MTRDARADTIYTAGRIHTLDPRSPAAEALAVRDGRILAVGRAGDVRRLAGPKTRAVDLAGRTVVPGLIDAHCHLAGLGRLLSGRLDLNDTESMDEMLRRVNIPRFAKLGVIASMQPTHATSDMRWAEDRLGKPRLAGAYAWASLVKSGARLAAGSDFPVESERPLLGFYAAVARQDASGKPEGGWLPAERLTREQALRAFTVEAAYAAFEENDKGTLEAGKLADFVVLDTDILTCPPAEILSARVLRTVIGGEEVWKAETSPGKEQERRL